MPENVISNNDVVIGANEPIRPGGSVDDSGGDIILRTGGVERARIKSDGTGSGWPSILGGGISYNGVTFLTPDQGGWSIFDRVKFMPPPSGDTTGATDTATATALLGEMPASGGILLCSGGTYYGTQVPIPTKTKIKGLGYETTTWRQAAGANRDFFVSSGFSALTGGGTSGGVSSVEIEDIEIDGNASGQTIAATTISSTTALPAATIPLTSTTGYSGGGGIANIMSTSGMQVITYTGVSGGNLTGCTGGTGSATAGFPAYTAGRGVAIFGKNTGVRRCWIHNCVGDGLWTEWSLTASATSTGSMEGVFEDNKYASNGVNGHQFTGPHDAVHRGCIAIANAFAGWSCSATGNFSTCHAWGSPQIYGYFVVTGNCTFEGCIGEVTNVNGSVGLYIGGIAGTVWHGGEIFVPPNSNTSGAVGVQIQGSSDTDVDTSFSGCIAAAFYLASDGGNNRIRGLAKQTLGPAVTHIITTVAAGSNGVDVSTFVGAQTLNVSSTTSFLAGGTNRYVAVATSAGGAILRYTAVAAGQLQNVTLISGSGTLATGGFVSQAANVNGNVSNDLSTVDPSTVVQMVVGGGTTAKNIDNTHGYTKKNGSITPSATINTYGTATAITPAAQASRAMDYGVKVETLSFTGTSIGAETLTIEVLANTVSGAQTNIQTITLTAGSPTYTLTALDIYNLVQIGTPFYFQVQAKSSIGSSGASVAWVFLGWS